MASASQTNSGASQTDPFSRKYKILSKIGEGSYSEVLKCKNRDTASVYACKRLKHCYRSWNQVNDIPEIVTLRKLARHPNILQMVEIHFDPSAGRVSLVFELMDMNLYELIKDRKRLLPESRVRVMMFQLMRALRHLHKHGIFHRDVKPENILLKNDLLKLGDLGSVRGLYSRPPYTEYISTRWYRSPECLLTCGYYSFKMDVWAAGCVFYEILTLRPLFPGSSELDQINRVHNVLGPPPQKIMTKFMKHAEIERDYSRHTSKQARLNTIKRVLGEMKTSNYDWYFAGKEPKGVDTLLPTHVTSEAKDLLKHLLQYDPDSRPSSHRALQHAYFKDLREQAQRAAREKLPSMLGPIVTIVGDEGGHEVTADDNANPVDLATLGDAKLKLKTLTKRTSDVKEVKESTSTVHKRSESSAKIFESIKSNLKEAGEMFIRDTTDEVDKKLKTSSPHTNPDSRRGIEDRAKIVAKTMASLRFGGDATSASLPYQKIYLDENDGDGPTNKEALSVEQLECRRKNPSNLNRRRGIPKLEVERKKSMTVMTNEPLSGRGFPLDFIDKAALTPDVMDRINENRRIAHMQPIISADVKKGREEDTSGYFNKKSYRANQEKKRQTKEQRSPTVSPSSFSPRNFHKKNSPRAARVDGNGNYGTADTITIDENRIDLYTEARIKYDPTNTEKHVKELLAALPLRRKQIDKPDVGAGTENSGKQHPDNSYKTYAASISQSKSQLAKNINNLRSKYEAEKKNGYHNLHPVEKLSALKKREHPSSKIRDNLIPKGSFTNFSPRVIKHDNNTGRQLEKSRYSRKEEIHIHSGRHESSRKNQIDHVKDSYNSKYRDSQKDLIYSQKHVDRKSILTDCVNGELNINQRYEKGIVHRHDLQDLAGKHNRDREREYHGVHHSQREVCDKSERHSKRSPKHGHSYEDQYNNISSGRKLHIPESTSRSGGSKSGGYLEQYDSAGSYSPTNFRRLIENRRKAELVTTDTDADGDHNYNKAKLTESSVRRKRRSRYSNLSPGQEQDLSITTKSFGYSPRDLLPPKYNNSNKSTDQQVSSRLSGVTAAFKYSNTSSVANRQVREILAEMRKRRDILEDRVAKDASLHPWNNSKTEEVPSEKTKVSLSTSKKSRDPSKRSDLGDRLASLQHQSTKTVGKSPYHSNTAKAFKPGNGVTSVADLNYVRFKDKAGNNKQDNPSSSKFIGVQNDLSTGKYNFDSETRLKGYGKSIETSKHPYQNTTGSGANSKIFPRNRYGAAILKK